MSDSEEEEKVVYVPFAQRSEWTDVVPIKEDEGPEPVCSIAYTPQFSDTMNYFRAILKADERSDRALALTREVIELNAANYTAWYFRRLVLEALKNDWKHELAFVSRIGSKNPKNYQIWHHRHYVIEKLNDFSTEYNYTADQIEEDSKNYHAWAHRQWVIQTTNTWDDELPFIDLLLKQDFRNNSAWNQRYFVISRNKTLPITEEIRNREIGYAFDWIKKAPNNQSPWIYLKGLFIDQKIGDHPELKKLCLEFRNKFTTSPHVASLLVDIYESEGTKESILQAAELCTALETSLDNIHRKYWVYRKQSLPTV